MSKNFHALTVSDVIQETKDTVSLVFAVPENLKETFQYTQGQYLTLRFTVNGSEERRAYSMSSSPLEPTLKVSVKRVKKGKVSNHIADKVKKGDKVDVMPPEGRFFTVLKEENRKTYYLFGAGSGVTPLMSIIKTTLEIEPQSSVYLLYGNRDEESIIFKDELDALAQKYNGQFRVVHTLSQPKREKPKGFGGLFKKGSISWEGQTGRIDAKKVMRFLAENESQYKDTEYFLCGPNEMIFMLLNYLTDKQGVEKSKVHFELFNTTGVVIKKKKQREIDNSILSEITIHEGGKDFIFSIPQGSDNILDAALNNHADLPFACKGGVCCTCRAKLIEGKVDMEVNYALEQEELDAGYILTCQAIPLSQKVIVDFD